MERFTWRFAVVMLGFVAVFWRMLTRLDAAETAFEGNWVIFMHGVVIMAIIGFGLMWATEREPSTTWDGAGVAEARAEGVAARAEQAALWREWEAQQKKEWETQFDARRQERERQDAEYERLKAELAEEAAASQAAATEARLQAAVERETARQARENALRQELAAIDDAAERAMFQAHLDFLKQVERVERYELWTLYVTPDSRLPLQDMYRGVERLRRHHWLNAYLHRPNTVALRSGASPALKEVLWLLALKVGDDVARYIVYDFVMADLPRLERTWSGTTREYLLTQQDCQSSSLQYQRPGVEKWLSYTRSRRPGLGPWPADAWPADIRTEGQLLELTRYVQRAATP